MKFTMMAVTTEFLSIIIYKRSVSIYLHNNILIILSYCYLQLIYLHSELVKAKEGKKASSSGYFVWVSQTSVQTKRKWKEVLKAMAVIDVT